MSYLDVYYSRINHLGATTAERIQNGGKRSFMKWMSQSPHTVRGLSVQRGIFFDGIILTSKDKQYEKIMFLNVPNHTAIAVGDIMDWKIENGTTQKWILIQEEKKVNGTYRTFWIVRCNYLLKWIDSNGHLNQSWAYFVSSLDSKIKGNFRTWNNLITPQPNKYAQILMPRFPIDRATNFIVEQESWTVVEYDHTSVPGIIYLSLTEGKINSIYDDIESNIADTDKLASYQLLTPDKQQIFQIGSIIEPVFTIVKNGQIYNGEVEYISMNKQIVKIVDGRLLAVGEGEVEIVIQLKDFPSIKKTITIQIGSSEQQFSAYIKGNDSIRLDRSSQYELVTKPQLNGIPNVYFSLSNNLAKIELVNNNKCTVKANDKNKLGTIILTAQYNNNTYTKEISIIPLW